MNEIVEETVFIPQISNTNQIHQQSHNDQHLKEFILWFVLLICLLLLAGPFTHHLSYSVPTVKTRTSARHVFSEERALDYLINLTQYGSRVRNTRGNFDARDYLILQIKRICSPNKRHIQCELDLQNFTDSQHNQLQNIFVRISNTLNKSRNIPSVMLAAHYDSVEFSPGAGDDGSGILFTNAEESELQGALAFITDHNWRFNIRHFFSIDSTSCNEVANLLRTTSPQLVIDYSRVTRPRANLLKTQYSYFLAFIMTITNLAFGYSKDPWTVYFGGQKIQGASATSFEILNDGYAEDPWNVYYMGKKIEGASASSFQSLGQGMAKDAFNRYHLGQKYSGLTPATHNFH
ncbi:unnamed protein product [Adineta steineri]|uniref:Peptidase M28 domain-containing protein n=2 Tax=Adineta steineri TaxID=433720 RepID=A0A813U400_9BILA|nr:unnamed protein product [Adineta steineri]